MQADESNDQTQDLIGRIGATRAALAVGQNWVKVYAVVLLETLVPEEVSKAEIDEFFTLIDDKKRSLDKILKIL